MQKTCEIDVQPQVVFQLSSKPATRPVEPTPVPNGFRSRCVEDQRAIPADVPSVESLAEASEGLVVNFAHQYQAVSRIDQEVARYEIKRRRTAEYWELGRLAAQLKEEIGHGKWLPYLGEHGYVERTVQRATYIYLLFKDRQEECTGLTLEQAEQFGKEAKKPKSDSQGPRESTGRQGELGAFEPGERNANPPISGDHGDGEVHKENEDVDTACEEYEEDDYTVKSELLYDILSEAIDPAFSLTDAERDALDTLMASIGDEDRAVRVLLSRIWTII